MNFNRKPSTARHLMWICSGFLNNTLHATRWLEITRELSKMNWSVTLVASGSPSRQKIRGVSVFCIPRPEVYCFRQIVFHLRLLRFLVRRWRTTDAVLFESMSSPLILLLRLARNLAGRRLPLFVLDTRTLQMSREDKVTRKDKVRGQFYRTMGLLSNHCADGQTAITKRIAETLHIPPEKVWGIWHSGVDMEQFTSARTARKWPKPWEPIRLIYIGNLNYERNLMAMSRAVTRANAEGMAFTLSLVGEGTERGDLESFAAQTRRGILVAPPVPYAQVWQVLTLHHVGVLPFPDEEKFRVSSPIKLFEYLASGLPVLATRIVCHTDVIGNGKCAFWAEDADVEGLLKVLRLIWQERYSLSTMGRQAARIAGAWTWHESAKKLRTALEYGLAQNQTNSKGLTLK